MTRRIKRVSNWGLGAFANEKLVNTWKERIIFCKVVPRQRADADHKTNVSFLKAKHCPVLDTSIWTHLTCDDPILWSCLIGNNLTLCQVLFHKCLRRQVVNEALCDVFNDRVNRVFGLLAGHSQELLQRISKTSKDGLCCIMGSQLDAIFLKFKFKSFYSKFIIKIINSLHSTQIINKSNWLK